MPRSTFPKPRANMQDVADIAGVSRSAVSLVLNGKEIRISDQKRQDIHDAAKQLNYRPNVGAVRLKMQKTDTLRLVLPGDPDLLGELFLLDMIRNLAAESKRRNYDLLLEIGGTDNHSLIHHKPGRVDGAIYILEHDSDPALTAEIEKAGEPFVIIGGSLMKHPPSHFVDFDVKEGAKILTSHLIDLGHRQIAFLEGVDSPHKKSGYLQTLREHNIPAPPDFQIFSGLEEKGITRALQSLLSLPRPPTAIVATNDTLAIAAMKSLTTMGLKVPRDMSITGFDDIAPANMVSPPLTTLNLPIGLLAEQTLRLMIEQFERRTPSYSNHQVVLPTTLVSRKSTRPYAPK